MGRFLGSFCKNTFSQIEEKEEENTSEKDSIVYTEYFEWCCKYFAQSVMCVPEEKDPESSSHQEHEFQLVRAARVKKAAQEEQSRAGEFVAIRERKRT